MCFIDRDLHVRSRHRYLRHRPDRSVRRHPVAAQTQANRFWALTSPWCASSCGAFGATVYLAYLAVTGAGCYRDHAFFSLHQGWPYATIATLTGGLAAMLVCDQYLMLRALFSRVQRSRKQRRNRSEPHRSRSGEYAYVLLTKPAANDELSRYRAKPIFVKPAFCAVANTFATTW